MSRGRWALWTVRSTTGTSNGRQPTLYTRLRNTRRKDRKRTGAGNARYPALRKCVSTPDRRTERAPSGSPGWAAGGWLLAHDGGPPVLFLSSTALKTQISSFCAQPEKLSLVSALEEKLRTLDLLRNTWVAKMAIPFYRF